MISRNSKFDLPSGSTRKKLCDAVAAASVLSNGTGLDSSTNQVREAHRSHIPQPYPATLSRSPTPQPYPAALPRSPTPQPYPAALSRSPTPQPHPAPYTPRRRAPPPRPVHLQKMIGLDELKRFLVECQDIKPSEADLLRVVNLHEPDALLRQTGTLSFEGFSRFMIDESNYAFLPDSKSDQVSQVVNGNASVSRTIDIGWGGGG